MDTSGPSELLSLPLELWEESLLPRMPGHSIVQLSMTCRTLRSALSSRVFSRVTEALPAFHRSKGPNGITQSGTCKALLKEFIQGLELLSASPTVAQVQSLRLMQARKEDYADDLLIVDIVDPHPKIARQRSWSTLAVEKSLPHLSGLPRLQQLALSDLSITHAGVHTILSLRQLQALTFRQCMLELEHPFLLDHPAKLRSFHWQPSRWHAHIEHLFRAVVTDSLRDLSLDRFDENILSALQDTPHLNSVEHLTITVPPMDLISYLAPLFPRITALCVLDEYFVSSRVRGQAPQPHKLPVVPTSLPSLSHLTAGLFFYIDAVLDLHPLETLTLYATKDRELQHFVEITRRNPSLQLKLRGLRLWFSANYAVLCASVADILLNCRALEDFYHHVHFFAADNGPNLMDSFAAFKMPPGIRNIVITMTGPASCLAPVLRHCTSLLRSLCSCDRLEFLSIEAVLKDGSCTFTHNRDVFGPLRADKCEKQYSLNHEHGMQTLKDDT